MSEQTCDDEGELLDPMFEQIEKFGTRKYAAMILMRKGEKALSQYLTPSEMERCREIANGPGL